MKSYYLYFFNFLKSLEAVLDNDLIISILQRLHSDCMDFEYSIFSARKTHHNIQIIIDIFGDVWVENEKGSGFASSWMFIDLRRSGQIKTEVKIFFFFVLLCWMAQNSSIADKITWKFVEHLFPERVELNDQKISELVTVKMFNFIFGPGNSISFKKLLAISLRIDANCRKANSNSVVNLHSKDGELKGWSINFHHQFLYIFVEEVEDILLLLWDLAIMVDNLQLLFLSLYLLDVFFS